MLESAVASETWGRYTFLGFDPEIAITCIGGEVNGVLDAGPVKYVTGNPSEYLRKVLSSYRSPRFDNLPPFTGGLVGYFAFDYFGYSEPSVRNNALDTENFKDVDLMLFDKVIAFDHIRQKIVLMANMRLDEPETNYTTFSSLAVAALGSNELTFLAEDVHCHLHVAIGLCEGLLAVHKSCLSFLAKCIYFL